MRESTASSYRLQIELHIKPALGTIPLQQLQPQDLDRFYDDELDHGRRDGKPGGSSPKSVRYLHTTIHKALKDAVRKNLVSRNVADAADPPHIPTPGERELSVWTAAELRQFLEAMSDHWLSAAFVLAATTGMRRGEVLGLRWSDVDLTAGRLNIRQTVLSVGGKVRFSQPKTARGRRTIALDETTIGALVAHAARQAIDVERLGASMPCCTAIWPNAHSL